MEIEKEIEVIFLNKSQNSMTHYLQSTNERLLILYFCNTECNH